MLEGLKVMKQVDGTIKSAEKMFKDDKGKDSKKKKGRPTCKRDIEEEKNKER